MIGNLMPSMIRTYTPLLVGFLIDWLAQLGVTVDSTKLNAAISVGLAAGYYALVRLLEQRWPQLGWLLGHPSKPVYTPITAATPEPAPAPVPVKPAKKTAKRKDAGHVDRLTVLSVVAVAALVLVLLVIVGTL